jgi:hypothetical protein
MDFVAIWKASSIVLTGAFGILGLLADFKNEQTKEITRWGYISLCGIVLSTVFGTVAQLKESHDSAAQTLKIAEQSNRMLQDIQKSLSPLGEIQLQFSFRVDCEDTKWQHLCQTAPNFFKGSLLMRANIFLSSDDAERFIHMSPGMNVIGDLNYGCICDDLVLNKTPEVELAGLSKFLDGDYNNGKITSVLDIHHATVVVHGGTDINLVTHTSTPSLKGLTLIYFTINTKDGRTIRSKGAIDKVSFLGEEAYRFQLE